MISILLDQGLPRSAASVLQDEGWDVLHTGDIGLSRATDRQILEYAQREERVILSYYSRTDKCFCSFCDSDPFGRAKRHGLAHLIKKIWPRIEPQVKKGAMVTVTESGIRIRNIPLFSS